MNLPFWLVPAFWPDLWRKYFSLSSARSYRLRLARRLTFSLPAQRESKQRESAPDIWPCISLRCISGAFAPSALQGHAAKGHPWPIAALAASMPLNPLHTGSTLPSDGTPSPCMPESRVDNREALSAKPRPVEKPQAAFSTLHESFGSRIVPVRRLSRGVVQQVSRQDAEKAPMDHGWSFGACLRSGTGARGVSRSETRMPGGVSFAYFALHKQTERSGVTAAGWPEGRVQRVKKVRRPAGRNQIFLINTKMKPCSTRCKWS